jgi:hypothetical protein
MLKNTDYLSRQTPVLCDIFHLKNRTSDINHYLKLAGLEAELLEQANAFLSGKVIIYNKIVFLKEFSIDKFNTNRNKHEVYNQDIRFHWEIYRARFLFNIAIAYQILKDERYALAIIEYIKSWKEFSPYTDSKLKFNGMESAIKLMNLSLLDPLLKGSPNYTGEIKDELINAIIFHAEYTYINYDITLYGLESNHGLSCAIGLVYASLLFPDCQNSKRWYNLGIWALRRALKKQFSKDGVNFESSTNYHRFVFEMLIFLLAAFYKQNHKVEPFIEKTIKKIGNSLVKLTHTNNMIPRFGDSDSGKFLWGFNSIDDFNDMEYLEWFTDFRKKQFFETILFDGISQFDGFLNKKKQNGKIGGYVSFKDKNLSLIISANEIGTLGKGNHQHNDFMSFELYSTTPFIVDPWSYCYTGNKELRNNDRKTKSHNCIEIDNHEIVPFNSDKLFEMLGNIKVKNNIIKETSEHWEASLTHNGYNNLKNGSQIHTRMFKYNKTKKELLIKDYLIGKGKHKSKLNLHIPQKYWKLIEKNGRLIFYNDEEVFELSNNLVDFEIRESIISEMFLNRTPSYFITIVNEYYERLEIILKITYKRKVK